LLKFVALCWSVSGAALMFVIIVKTCHDLCRTRQLWTTSTVSRPLVLARLVVLCSYNTKQLKNTMLWKSWINKRWLVFAFMFLWPEVIESACFSAALSQW